MSAKKLSAFFGILMVLSLILSGCATPAAPGVPQVVTQIVEKEVKVVETQVVETVKEVEKEVQVVVTPTPLPAEKVVRINLGSYPDIIDPQKSSFVNEIAHLQLIYEGFGTKAHAIPWTYLFSKEPTAETGELGKWAKYSPTWKRTS